MERIYCTTSLKAARQWLDCQLCRSAFLHKACLWPGTCGCSCSITVDATAVSWQSPRPFQIAAFITATAALGRHLIGGAKEGNAYNAPEIEQEGEREKRKKLVSQLDIKCAPALLDTEISLIPSVLPSGWVYFAWTRLPGLPDHFLSPGSVSHSSWCPTSLPCEFHQQVLRTRCSAEQLESTMWSNNLCFLIFHCSWSWPDAQIPSI